LTFVGVSSGAWSRPYREAGYEVHIITLPEFDVTKTLLGDYPDITFRPPLENGDFWPDGTISLPYSRIAGILAAPPCTEFSIAKGGRPRDLMGAMAVVEICMQIIWEVQIHTKLDFWALENPRGLLRRFLGKPAYTFEQWQFGGELSKPTDIWGYFNPPAPTVKEKPEIAKYLCNGRANTRKFTPVSYANPKVPPEYSGYISQFTNHARRAAIRAITPTGFADAFYRANKPKGR
jgi:hypothetical protein